MSLLSECCSARPLGDLEELGICSDCCEHCEFYDDEKEDNVPREFSTQQLTVINRIITEAATCCHECGQKVARFSDGATLHHQAESGAIDLDADMDHTPYLQADRL